MIRPIQLGDKEWQDVYEIYGLTKFIAKNGDGHRGVIVEVSTDGKEATLCGVTGEYSGKLVKVVEDDPDEWPKEVEA